MSTVDFFPVNAGQWREVCFANQSMENKQRDKKILVLILLLFFEGWNLVFDLLFVAFSLYSPTNTNVKKRCKTIIFSLPAVMVFETISGKQFNFFLKRERDNEFCRQTKKKLNQNLLFAPNKKKKLQQLRGLFFLFL